MTKPVKKTLYLHIGLHKTGTTALQFFLNANMELLAEKGLHYAPFQMGSQAGGTCGNGQQLFLGLRQHNEALCESFVKMVRETSHSRVLISCEMLDLLDTDEITCLKNLFKDVHCKIIVYLRRQDKFITSIVNQHIGFWKKMDFQYDARYTMECVDRYAQVFGKENIIVRVYERGQFHGGTIFSDFLAIFGEELTAAYQIPPQSNPPLGRDFLEVKRLCNALPFNNHLLRGELLPPLTALTNLFDRREIFATPEVLSPAQKVAILDDYAAFNEHVARDYMGRSDGRLFLEPEPRIDDPWQPYEGIPQDVLVQTFFMFHLGLIQKMKEQTCQLQLDGKRIAVWGLGEHYLDYVAGMLKDFAPRADIVCLVDSNTALFHTLLHGKEVLLPENLLDIEVDAVVIATLHVDNVREKMRSLHLDHIPAYAL